MLTAGIIIIIKLNEKKDWIAPKPSPIVLKLADYSLKYEQIKISIMPSIITLKIKEKKIPLLINL